MIPESYTEEQLVEYMHTSLGTVADVLGWSPTASYIQPMINTLIEYGVDVPEDAKDVHRLRLTARQEVWRAARDATAGLHDIGSVGAEANMNLSAIHKHATDMFFTVRDELAEYVTGGRRIRRIPIKRTPSPYHRINVIQRNV